MIEKEQKAAGEATTELPQNVAGLLCYLGVWITGIVFLIIEQKNKFVRFHAIQSIVVFGALTIASAMLSWIPAVGGFFGAVIGILAFILWLILMIRAYQGVLFKVPVAGEVAMAIFTATEKSGGAETDGKQEGAETATGEYAEPAASAAAKKSDDIGKRIEEYITSSRAGKIAGYSFAIFWNAAFLIFLTFFNKYIAWYATETDGSVTRLSMLTDDFSTWLPIFITVTILTMAAYCALIIYDKYWFRETVQIFISVFGIISAVALVSIFPFDFSVIPNATAVEYVPVAVRVVLILTAVGLGISIFARFAKMMGKASS